jgi:DNA polymerase III subunit chi
MTEVAFHFNAPDKLEYVCRLSRKAYGVGSRVVVTGSNSVLDRLDVLLWTFSSPDFLPHCKFIDNDSVSESSPILLSESLVAVPYRDVLINLGEGVPNGFEAFHRLIEVVSTEEQDRGVARSRWKHYLQLGIEPVRHDLALKT